MSFITVDPKYPVYDGIPLTFRAPCDSKDAEGLLVANTKYYFRDANSDDVTGINRLFSAGAYVSVTLDTTKKYAYITNAVTNYSNTVAGDILETVRTDLGDRWLLCNGDLVRDGQYPKLREVMPYNTEWRKVAQYSTYPEVRAIPIAGQWALCDVKNMYDPSSSKTAAVYDASTDSVTEIQCPTINTTKGYGIFGLTHDGEKYILGVNEFSNGEGYPIVHLFTSTDLVNWTDKKQFTMDDYRQPYDLMFDGSVVLIACGDYSEFYSDYRMYVYYVDKALTAMTRYSGEWESDDGYYYFVACPNRYWAFTNDDDKTFSAYKSGGVTNRFYLDYNGRAAFFNDKYWIGAPNVNQYVHYIETYNIETGTKQHFTAESVVGTTGTLYLRGVEYNKNANEWMLYISGAGNTNPCYIAYISADADPNDLTQYRVVRVEALPELHNVKMAPDRSKMTAGNLLRDPNQKYLPKHSGDTLKYIYTG